ncbi:MAG: DUF4352 domain-containing protein [Candidatus Diapherotrites archaeon]|nr:DUF4352 domain-containing protein [Candidatus Diapherotrites archaeon]
MKNKLKFIFLIGLVLLIFGCTQTTPETNTSDELDPALKGIIAREVARESGVSEQGARDFLDTVSDPAVQRQIEESSRELEERQTGNANAQERNVSGAMREKLSNGHIELQVNKVEYRTQIDEDGLLKVEEGYDYKFILLNLTVKNLGTQPIAWLTSDFENIYQGYSNTFGLRTSNPRNPVGLLESCAIDKKMKNGIDSSALQPGE